MKKLLSMILLTVLILSTAPTVFASEQVPGTTQITGANSEEVQAFRAAVKEKRDLIKAAAEENKLLRQATAETRALIKQILGEMKAGGTEINPATLEQLNTYREQVAVKVEALVASKGAIKAYMDANRDSLKSLDYAVLENMYAEV